MDMNDIRSIYDQLCAVLTDYETNDGTGDAGDAGELLYLSLCRVVNEFAEKLN